MGTSVLRDLTVQGKRNELTGLVEYRSSSFSAVSRHFYMYGKVRRVL